MDSLHKIVQTKYGVCKIKKHHNHKLPTPSIRSAIDKTQFFANMANEIYNNKYDYSKAKYINNITPVIIICKEHGEFRATPNVHLSNKKQECPTCTKNRPNKRLLTTEGFIEKSNKKHNNFYNYSLVKYVGQSSSVKIICPIHGEFIQVPKDHMRGGGCRKCANQKISKSRRSNPTGWEYSRWIKFAQISKWFDSYKFYIIECWDKDENFIKIGRTYRKVSRRFRTLNMLPYNYKTLYEIIDSGIKICKIEEELKRVVSKYKYVPIKSFNGMHECYSKDCLDKLISSIPR